MYELHFSVYEYGNWLFWHEKIGAESHEMAEAIGAYKSKIYVASFQYALEVKADG